MTVENSGCLYMRRAIPRRFFSCLPRSNILIELMIYSFIYYEYYHYRHINCAVLCAHNFLEYNAKLEKSEIFLLIVCNVLMITPCISSGSITCTRHHNIKYGNKV